MSAILRGVTLGINISSNTFLNIQRFLAVLITIIQTESYYMVQE